MGLVEEQDGLLLMKLAKIELEAVLALRSNSNFKTFMETIAREAEVLNKRMVCSDSDPTMLVRMQGQLRSYIAIMDAVSNAESAYALHTKIRT